MLEINKREGSLRVVNGDGVSSSEGVPAQTEKGELVVTPTGEIANVASNRLHSEMDEDEITDILEAGSYVLSNATDGSMNITRAEAEEVSLGQGISYFDELGKSTSAVERTLADFFPAGVDELTPAELGKRIRSRYPLTNRDDSYSKITNLENKKNRENALLQLVSLNESKRPENDAFELYDDNTMDVPEFKFGGDVLNMNTGGPVSNTNNIDDYMNAIDFMNQVVSDSKKNTPELLRLKKMDQMRRVGRMNPDGSQSTVIMASAEVDGKFVAFPTLFPKDPNNYTSDPNDWVEMSGEDYDKWAAYDEALRRGEVFEFNSPEEAAAFAGGSWKQTPQIDDSGQRMFGKGFDRPNEEVPFMGGLYPVGVRGGFYNNKESGTSEPVEVDFLEFNNNQPTRGFNEVSYEEDPNLPKTLTTDDGGFSGVELDPSTGAVIEPRTELDTKNIQGVKIEDPNEDPLEGMTEIERRYFFQREEIDKKNKALQDEYTKIIEDSTAKARAGVNADLEEYVANVARASRIYDRQSTIGFMANMAINAAQDPSVDTVDLTDQINAAKAELDRTPEYMKEYQTKGLSAQARNNAEMMFQNTNQFNRAASNLAATNAKISEALSDIAVANNQNEIDQYNKRVNTIGALRSKQDAYDTDQANKERANLNTKIAAYGNSIENYLGELKMTGLSESNAINTANYQASNALKELDARSDFNKLRQNQLEQLALNQRRLGLDIQQAREENRMNPVDTDYVTTQEGNAGVPYRQGGTLAPGRIRDANGNPVEVESYSSIMYPYRYPISYQAENGLIDSFVQRPTQLSQYKFPSAEQLLGQPTLEEQQLGYASQLFDTDPLSFEEDQKIARANNLLGPVTGGINKNLLSRMPNIPKGGILGK